ncbi:MAG: hypothetical protein JWQ90_4491 [Hydrocarboniphaga sp.]|uniref:glycosyltransferase family 4 protein n=1 Tax=Hydrocarboniphaga sp. TaxID=2033016 RepID=UPI002635DBC2|nr:glycosyltransferase family 1 protein [Hydrocarboniphaga sp.]MDB5972041.1 hypothetical protein [Hydrocarboniphaga sp.]
MPDPQRLRVLMELRPCYEGYAGIPQETRLLFSALNELESVEVVGLLNHPIHPLARTLKAGETFDDSNVHRKYNLLSRFIANQRAPRPHGTLANASATFKRGLGPTGLALAAAFGGELPLRKFDARDFGDFVWETLFSKSLPPEDYDKIRNAGYRSLSTPWRMLHRTGLSGFAGLRRGHYPRLATQDFDVFIGQTPYPAEVAPQTQMLVRYHDAIPLFLPHLIPHTRFHRATHYRALIANARRAVFVCTSAAVRDDLLRVLPQVERRSLVVPDVVSHNYFVEPAATSTLIDIMLARLNQATLPKSLESLSKSLLLKREFASGNLRYLLIVSTVEPRKNHVRLVRAWERLRSTVAPGLKLIVVGELGWDTGPMTDAFRPWQERGELLHLARVPSSDLRRLYGAAECVVCPSVSEGFDLSGVEAMLCGAPVVASDIPVHREVYGNAAEYFETYSEDSLGEQLSGLLGAANAGRRAALAEAGQRHAERYRKEAITPQWNALFERLRRGEFRTG